MCAMKLLASVCVTKSLNVPVAIPAVGQKVTQSVKTWQFQSELLRKFNTQNRG